MILIAIGANLSNVQFKRPRAACGAALEHLNKTKGITIKNRSHWYRTAPVPVSDQPWYVNAVIEIECTIPPLNLMQVLLDTEQQLGRIRSTANAPRIIDLDLLSYENKVMQCDQTADHPALSVPHPRMHERAFVLFPLSDINRQWAHPITHKTVEKMIAELSPGQQTERMSDAAGVFGTEWHAANTD